MESVRLLVRNHRQEKLTGRNFIPSPELREATDAAGRQDPRNSGTNLDPVKVTELRSFKKQFKRITLGQETRCAYIRLQVRICRSNSLIRAGGAALQAIKAQGRRRHKRGIKSLAVLSSECTEMNGRS